MNYLYRIYISAMIVGGVITLGSLIEQSPIIIMGVILLALGTVGFITGTSDANKNISKIDYSNDNGVFYEFAEFFDSLKPERFSRIGDIFEVVSMEDGTDFYRGKYMLVKLNPLSKRVRDEENEKNS